MYYKNIVRYDYDALGRINSKTMHTGLFSYKSEYTYVSGTAENSTTSKVSSIKNNNGAPITYEYNANGNITKATRGLVSITYYYNELIQEDNQVLNKTVIYSYDAGGNLMNKLDIIYEVVDRTTIAYEYDSIWKDKLLKYNGKSITYDAIGNPLAHGGEHWDVNYPNGRYDNVFPPDGNLRKGSVGRGKFSTAGKRIVSDAAVAGGTALLLYSTYRIIRIVPSLAPPLWWTIPENLALP